MRSFKLREFVATMVKNAPSKSAAEKARNSSSSFPARVHSRTVGLASSATTRIRAPVPSRPPIFGSPTFPAPTTRHCLPSSFKNIGNKLVTETSCRLHQSASRIGHIAGDRGHDFSRQKLTQLRVAMPNEEPAQVFARFALCQVLAQQTLERIRNLSRGAAISDWARRGLMETERSTHAEVVGIHHAVLNFDFFTLNPDVSDPMLAATVRASSNVQLQMLIEAGQTFFQFFHQPAGETLGFGDGQLAEFRSAARHRAAPEGGTADFQPDCIELFRQSVRVEGGYVHDEQVLHVRGTQFAASKALGEIRRRLHLLRRDSSAQRHCTHIRQAGLLLRM